MTEGMLPRTLKFHNPLPTAHSSHATRTTAAAILAQPAVRPVCEKSGDLSILDRNRQRALQHLQKDAPSALLSPDLDDDTRIHVSALRERSPPPAAARVLPQQGE